MKFFSLLVALILFVALMTPVSVGQVNHKPLFRFRVPVIVPYIPTQPLRFFVSAYDPDGDTLTYTWKINARIVQTGPDSSYLLMPSDLQYPLTKVTCIFSDPFGLADSTYWSRLGPDVYVEEHTAPTAVALVQNFPNPFNPSTIIRFRLPSIAHVKLEIYNAIGTQVASIIDADQRAGTHEITWKPVISSGTYFCRLTVGSNVLVRKMILIK